METKKLTREEAIKAVGIDAVGQVESEHCQFSSYLAGTDNAWQIWSSKTRATDESGEEVTLEMVFEVASEDIDPVEDLSDLDWEDKFSHFEVY